MQAIAFRRSLYWAVAFIVTILMQAILLQPAHAATFTWDGGGDGTTFSDATNWVGDVVPGVDDSIVLDTTSYSDGHTFNNDLAPDTRFSYIGLHGTGSGIFTLTGNSIALTNPGQSGAASLRNASIYNYPQFVVELDITLSGNVWFNADSKLVVGALDGSNTLNVATYTMTKTGKYPLLINSAASGSGGITVSDGNFEAVGTSSVAITIATGGTLSGSGTVGDVTVNSGGTVAPGMSPGCLSTGDLTYNSGSTYAVEIDGATVCTEYDQTQVTGTVTLGDATLSIVKSASYTPTVGTKYIVIDNDGADAVVGTFAGLAEGATTTVDGVEYTVSYVGGDGNDVVLSATVVSAPNTGFGLVSSNYLLVAVTTIMLTTALVFTGRRIQKVRTK